MLTVVDVNSHLSVIGHGLYLHAPTISFSPSVFFSFGVQEERGAGGGESEMKVNLKLQIQKQKH
eukprot:scaffold7820_cov99-Skeletonema_marinoi.AAC.2